jgi:hypothetical protein
MLREHSRIVLERWCQWIGCNKIHAQGLAAHDQTPQTWEQRSNSLHEWGTSKLSKRAYLNAIKNSSHDWKVKNLFVWVYHGYEELNKTMQGIEHNKVHWIVSFKIFIVHTLDVRQPSLQPMVVVPHKKHSPWEKLHIRISKKKVLKIFIFKTLVGIPRVNIKI